MILANCVPLSEWEGGDYIIGANQARKYACSLLNCISVTDDSETNEQNKSIATGLLSAHSEFDTFSALVRGEMWISNPRGQRLLYPRHGKGLDHKNRFSHREMVWEQVYEI